MKKEEERIKDMIGIVFFSVFFAIPVTCNASHYMLFYGYNTCITSY
ncbi:hypothetical protein [Bacillus manliponensis]